MHLKLEKRASLHQIDANRMGIDLVLLQDDKGGDLASVRLSEQRRGGDGTLVDSVLAMYKEWTRGQSTTFLAPRPLISLPLSFVRKGSTAEAN